MRKQLLIWILILAMVLGGCGKNTVAQETGTKPTATTAGETTAAPSETSAPALLLKSYTVSDDVALAMKDVVVATAGGEELTNGLLKIFYWKRITNFLNNYGDYLAMINLDLTKPLDQQLAIGSDDFTWQEYFIEGAIADWQRYLSLQQAGIAADIGLPQDLKEEFGSLYDTLNETAKEYDYESVEALIADQIGVGVSYDDYRTYFEMYYLGLAYYNSFTQSIEVTMDEIDAYYEENAEVVMTNYGVSKGSGMAGSVRHILIKPVDADADGELSDLEWSECLEKATDCLWEWKESDGTQEGFAELAKTLSEDTGSKEQGGLYEGIYKGYGFVESFENWVTNESRQTGDTGIIQSSYGYHIMYYVSGEAAWITCTRELVHEQKLTDHLEEVMAAYAVETDLDKIALDEMILATSAE